MTNTTYVDLSSFELGNGGLNNYYWPVSHLEIDSFRNELAAWIIPIIEKDDKLLPLSIGRNYLIRTLMRIWYAQTLKERAGNANVKLHAPEHCTILKTILEGEVVPPHEFEVIKQLRFKHSNIKSYAYIAGLGGIAETVNELFKREKKDIPVSGSLSSYDVNENIVVVNHNKLLLQELKARDVSSLQTRNEYWFRPILLDSLSVEINSFVEDVINYFSNKGIKIKKNIKQSLHNFLSEYTRLIYIHLTRLRKRNILPEKLWTGTGGNILSMILRQAVLERDGEVWAFDHSIGRGFAKSPDMAIVEFNCCNYFVTDGSIREAAANEDLAQLKEISNSNIKILSVKNSSIDNDERNFANKNEDNAYKDVEPIKKLMYCSTIYPGDTMHMKPHVPDMMMIDWQARLIEELSNRGYFVYHKTHPECQFSPPGSLYKNNACVIGGRFEDVSNMAEVVITDKINSTIVKSAIEKKIPLVYINIDQWNWRDGVLDCIKRRMGYIEAEIDLNNRIRVDFDSLVIEIDRAKHLAHESCFHKFIM